jgi:hypothetical protein
MARLEDPAWISTNPRDVDTDDDTLSDEEEYRVLFTDPTKQDTDGDTLDDQREVEFFKTNALDADSDGDGYGGDAELLRLHRDPRLADLPAHQIHVGSVSLQLDQRFTYVDAEGATHSETQTTSSSLENATSTTSTDFNQSVGRFGINFKNWLRALSIRARLQVLGSALRRLRFQRRRRVHHGAQAGVLAGENGRVDSAATGDDLQVLAVGAFPLAPTTVVLAAGPNGVLDTKPAGDDVVIGPDGIRPHARVAARPGASNRDDARRPGYGESGCSGPKGWDHEGLIPYNVSQAPQSC